MSTKSKTRLLNVRDYVALDTETTGLDTKRCEIIELAGVKINAGETVDTFQAFVKPRDGYGIPSFITKLTGITNEMVADAHGIEYELPRFFEFIGNMPVIGQNVSFDIKFMECGAIESGIDRQFLQACDIMRLSRIVFPDLPRHRLRDTFTACCDVSGNTPDFGKQHRALADSMMTMFCYETMRPYLVDKYGEDPDAEWNRQKRFEAYASYKEFLENVSPTVEEIDESNPFFGSNICFTGKLSSLTRKGAWQEAVNLGAVPQKSVTKKTDYLVVGYTEFSASLKGRPSSKRVRAQELYERTAAPQIVSEEFFMQFVS